MRSWVIWLSFLLLAATLGWFWLLSHELRFTRVEPDAKPPVAEQKTEAKKSG